MKSKITILLLLCFFACMGADEKSDPKADKFDTVVKSDRYEDFTHKTTTYYKSFEGWGPRTKDKVVIEFTPKKVGAYFIEVPGVISTKFIIGAGDLSEWQSTTQPVGGKMIEWFNISEFWVTFSDGKCIERTTVRLDN